MSVITFHIGEPGLDINLVPLTANDAIRMLITVHSGHVNVEQRTDMYFNGHPQQGNPLLSCRLSSDADRT